MAHTRRTRARTCIKDPHVAQQLAARGSAERDGNLALRVRGGVPGARRRRRLRLAVTEARPPVQHWHADSGPQRAAQAWRRLRSLTCVVLPHVGRCQRAAGEHAAKHHRRAVLSQRRHGAHARRGLRAKPRRVRRCAAGRQRAQLRQRKRARTEHGAHVVSHRARKRAVQRQQQQPRKHACRQNAQLAPGHPSRAQAAATRLATVHVAGGGLDGHGPRKRARFWP
jgi:hypothetical protein